MAVSDSDLPLGALAPDPRNARSHDARNLGFIAAALRDVGAAHSIVGDETGTVLAGNTTVQAAGQAGLSRVRIFETDGTEPIAVRRLGLTPDQKTRLALYDTGTAELADRDTEVLATLAKIGRPHSGTVKRGDRGGGASQSCDAMRQPPR